ncbi:MAG: ATP synthase F1 subunit delta [Deltaproteobacteria bacterium]|nr:ATP synthase F1 subunit delta [bacterium]MCB9480002.1 ATP synthase F1 subunit delta [Deltaproteobacteria bacterium]MCB9487731.1 ATP synthase F1 subunit delta [Deltaproteobacteria bacterium]
MSDAAIARRYAQAFLDLAEKDGKIDEYGAELDDFAQALAPSLETLAGPLLTIEQKKSVVGRIVEQTNPTEKVAHLLYVLVEKGRIGELSGIAAAYRELGDEAAGRLTANVVSAAELSDEAKNDLSERLGRKLGKNVQIQTSVDPSLIGGIRTQIGSLVIDGSLAGQLERFEGHLRKG